MLKILVLKGIVSGSVLRAVFVMMFMSLIIYSSDLVLKYSHNMTWEKNRLFLARDMIKVSFTESNETHMLLSNSSVNRQNDIPHIIHQAWDDAYVPWQVIIIVAKF